MRAWHFLIFCDDCVCSGRSLPEGRPILSRHVSTFRVKSLGQVKIQTLERQGLLSPGAPPGGHFGEYTEVGMPLHSPLAEGREARAEKGK